MRSRADAAVVAAAVVASSVVAVLTHDLAGDPFSRRAQGIALVVALAVAVGLGVMRATGRRVTTGAAGAVAIPVWIAFFCAWQLAGTPYPYGGNLYDIGRLSALATRFTVATGSADQFVPRLPSDYPPLFPWVVGKAAVVTGIPAWSLLGLSEVVVTAVAVAAGFVLWRRVLSAPLALAVSAIPAMYQGDPRKAYEVIAVCVITPWILATFGRWPDAPRLHWFPAGVIGGLMIADYLGYLVYAALGIGAIVVMGLLRAGRRPYIRHVILTAVVAGATASWYLVPWLSTLARQGGHNMWVHYLPADVRANLWYLPWRRGPLIGTMLISGFVLLVVFCRRRRWARYLLAIALGAMVYRWTWAFIYERTGNTGILEYTGRLSDGVLTIGLVVGVAELWRTALTARPRRLWPKQIATRSRRMSWLVNTGVPAVALTVTLAGLLSVYWSHQRVGAPGPNFAKLAHATALPDGRSTRYAGQARIALPRFPAAAIRGDVESVLGRDALPVTLSYSEEISAFYPFYLYLGVGSYSANSMSRWPRRAGIVAGLAATGDPAAFARACAHTRYGPIDVFILQQGGPKQLVWRHALQFRPAQFSSRYWVEFREAEHSVVFVRRGAVVAHHAYPG